MSLGTPDIHYCEQVAKGDAPFPTSLVMRFANEDIDTTIEQCCAFLRDSATPARVAGHLSLVLGRLGDARAADSLISVLSDSRKAENAACALVDLRAPRAVLPVIKALAHFATKNSSDWRAREYVKDRLGSLLEPNTPQYAEVAQIWRSARGNAGRAEFGMVDVPEVTAWVLEGALAKAGGEATVEIASGWVKSESYAQSLAGVAALADAATQPDATAMLFEVARSHRRLLTSLANPDVVQEKDGFRDNTEHRVAAMKALSRAGAPGADALFLTLSRDQDPAVREAAIALKSG